MHSERTKSNKGFAADPHKASLAGKKAKSRQSRAERSKRSSHAARARWGIKDDGTED